MERKTPHPITKEDFDKLLLLAKADRSLWWKARKKTYSARGQRIQQYIIAMCLGFGSGMRISEIFGLTKKQRYIYTNKEGVKTDKYILSDIPALTYDAFEERFIYLKKRKNGKSGRVLLPNKLFRQAKISHEVLKRKLPLKVSYRSTQLYFTNLCKRALNKHSTFHQLRHGFITHALTKTSLEIHEVQQLAGHSRMDTTGLYLHSVPDDMADKYEEEF
jgi:integrase